MDNKELITKALNMSEHIMTLGDLFREARDRRQSIDHTNLCTYNIESIDNRMKGIGSSDLVVIGAGSGAGKTQLAINTVLSNASKGKKVFFFMLEGDTDEIYLRYMQSEIMKYQKMSPIDFARNIDPNGAIKKIEDEQFEKVPQDIMDNVFIFRKKKIPDIEMIVDTISSVQSNIDMIVIDHAQYIEYPDDKSEAAALSKIMNVVKNITDTLNKPVVLFSHVVKPDTKGRRENISSSLLTKAHLHGSSNIYKQASVVIMIEPLHDSEEKYLVSQRGEVVTRISILKGRVGSGGGREDTYMLFDLNKYKYTRETTPAEFSKITF